MPGKILVVDDEPDMRELFNITLTMAGFKTETAKDGQEAVAKLKDGGLPDLVVLDLMMPRLDGFGVLGHVREKMADKPLRVLVATAKVLEEADHELLSTWPVFDVLDKDKFDIVHFITRVNEILTKNPNKHQNGGSQLLGRKLTD